MFGSLLKATVGVVIETPVALVKDVVTLGGACTDEDKPYTAQALEKVAQNLSNATDPNKD
jgi:hypothetical protein